jgi:hypothetical protein
MLNLSDLFVSKAVLYQPMVMVFLWIIIFTSDFVIKYRGAVLYYKYVKPVFQLHSGYFFKQFPEDKVNDFKYLFTFYIFSLVITSTLFGILLYLSVLHLNPAMYEFICGFFILLEACIHIRHIRMVTFFSFFRSAEYFHGVSTIPNWIIHKTAAVEYATFGIGFMLVTIFSTDNFFTQGGVTACLTAFLFHITAHIGERTEHNKSITAN